MWCDAKSAAQVSSCSWVLTFGWNLFVSISLVECRATSANVVPNRNIDNEKCVFSAIKHIFHIVSHMQHSLSRASHRHAQNQTHVRIYTAQYWYLKMERRNDVQVYSCFRVKWFSWSNLSVERIHRFIGFLWAVAVTVDAAVVAVYCHPCNNKYGKYEKHARKNWPAE